MRTDDDPQLLERRARFCGARRRRVQHRNDRRPTGPAQRPAGSSVPFPGRRSAAGRERRRGSITARFRRRRRACRPQPRRRPAPAPPPARPPASEAVALTCSPSDSAGPRLRFVSGPRGCASRRSRTPAAVLPFQREDDGKQAPGQRRAGNSQQSTLACDAQCRMRGGDRCTAISGRPARVFASTNPARPSAVRSARRAPPEQRRGPHRKRLGQTPSGG